MSLKKGIDKPLIIDFLPHFLTMGIQKKIAIYSIDRDDGYDESKQECITITAIQHALD